MIEQAMFYTLGFVSAGLLALACLPAVWKRAVRLTHRRLRQLVPLSADEIAAERDQMRAGFAVEQRRLEQRLDRSEATRTGLLADSGRHEARQAALEGDVKAASKRGDGLLEELQAAQQDLYGLQASNGTAEIALYDLTGLAERRLRQVQAAEAHAQVLESSVDEGRASVAALETRVLGLETRLVDLNKALGLSKAELARTVEAVSRAQAERDAARRSGDAAAAERDALRGMQDRQGREEPDERTQGATAERGSVEPGQTETAQRATIDELKAERDTLAAEIAMRREAHDGATATIADLRRKIADRPASPSMPTEADIAIVRDQLRALSEEILKAVRPQPAAEVTATAASNVEYHKVEKAG